MEKRVGELYGMKGIAIQMLLLAISDYSIPAFRYECNMFLDSALFEWISAVIDQDKENLKKKMLRQYEKNKYKTKRDWLNPYGSHKHVQRL